jgi:glycosyltransferase involved in cell wall biosynthesis
VEIVHGAVDLMRFPTTLNGRIRQELGVDASHVLIATVGCAIPRKGWDIAIRAFAKVQRLIPTARLILVGSTTSPQETEVFRQLTELVKNCRVQEYVHFLGHRNDFPEILKASDVFILPSRSEGLPAALLEAMAAGLPCVATRICGMTEVITDSENGLLFEKEDIDALSGHLIRLIQDQRLRVSIATPATERARAFSIEAYVNTVYGYYEALLGNQCC